MHSQIQIVLQPLKRIGWAIILFMQLAMIPARRHVIAIHRILAHCISKGVCAGPHEALPCLVCWVAMTHACSRDEYMYAHYVPMMARKKPKA